MENQLEIIVKESGLETTKAQYILDKFQNYFAIAAEWEQKARMIKVTDASQEVDMQMARTGRLFLREKRIAIEKSRKELKEQALREGKAIDGIANVLKALIVPIEEYLDQQEHYVEIQEQKKRDEMLIEAQKKEEEEKIAQEKALFEEQERIKKENERLKKENEEKERTLQAEREKAIAERKTIEETNRKEKEAAEKKAQAEREKAIAEERTAAEEARKKQKEEDEQEKMLLKKRADEEKKKLEEQLKRAQKIKLKIEKIVAEGIDCPYCGKHINLEEEIK